MPASKLRGAADRLPRVAVLTLGGTIGMASALAAGQGIHPALSGDELLGAIPGLDSVAEVRVIEIMNRPSPHLTFDDLWHLSIRIRQEITAGVQGVVVVQGTDTIEVTAFALDMLIMGGTPVVVTGAMRAAQVPGADGPANLLAAVRVAASPICRGLGTLVVMNDEIHAARHVTKGHSSSPAAFRSDPGPIGRIVEERPEVTFHPRLASALDFSLADILAPRPARVAHLPAEIGDDGSLVEAALETGCDGIVVSGMGGGHVAPTMVPALASAAAKLPVVLASKCPAGGGLANTYGYAGSKIDLTARGLIRAGHLTPAKAHAALTLLLRHGQPIAAIRAFFHSFGGG